MKEQDLIQTQVSTLPCYDVEDAEPVESPSTTDNNDTETKLHPMRTIRLSECAIPE
jgi:hypothetical protein